MNDACLEHCLTPANLPARHFHQVQPLDITGAWYPAPGTPTRASVKDQALRDGNTYLKIAFTDMAVHAIQYYPEYRKLYQKMRRRALETRCGVSHQKNQNCVDAMIRIATEDRFSLDNLLI